MLTNATTDNSIATIEQQAALHAGQQLYNWIQSAIDFHNSAVNVFHVGYSNDSYTRTERERERERENTETHCSTVVTLLFSMR